MPDPNFDPWKINGYHFFQVNILAVIRFIKNLFKKEEKDEKD